MNKRTALFPSSKVNGFGATNFMLKTPLFALNKRLINKEDFHQLGFRRTGRASAGVSTGRRVFSLPHPH